MLTYNKLPKFIRKSEAGIELRTLWILAKHDPRKNKRRIFLNAIAIHYIPGYGKFDKARRRWTMKVKRHWWNFQESRPMMWLATNQHKPLILFGLLKWVNVYEVTRHYGGAEEGGWWYNQYNPIERKLVLRKNAEAHREFMQEQYAECVEGNIYSVLGGTDIAVWVEDKRGQLEPSSRPHYE